MDESSVIDGRTLRGKYGASGCPRVFTPEEYRERLRRKAREYYRKNKEIISEKQKVFYRENKEEIQDRQRVYFQTSAGRAAIHRHLRKYRKENPEKVAARRLLRNAVLRGEVVKLPCRYCGNSNSEGHHTDYSKPLEVIWLCRKHHSAEHNVQIPS